MDLLRTIQHAHRILDWQENCIDDEMPPRWMWPFDDELETWFDGVMTARKAKFSSPGSDEEPEGGMEENELARGRR